MKLHRLAPEAQFLVTEAFARGEIARYEPSAYERFLDEASDPVVLDELDAEVADLLATTVRHDPSIDQRAAARLHRSLPLSRREAAMPGVWRYLAVAHLPELVRHRWAVETWATTRTRYWNPGMRHDSNVFSRLWWVAELTRDVDDYALTDRVFARQSIAVQVFVRRYSWHRPAVVALMDELEDATPRVVDRVTRDLVGALGTLALEALSLAELRLLIKALREGADRSQ